MARSPRKAAGPPLDPPPAKPQPPPPPVASRARYVAGTPRVPQGPPVESPWQMSAKAARSFLEKTRSVEEVDDLVKAGRLGVSFAEVFRYFYPYRDVITGERGLLRARPSPVPKTSHTIFSADYEQEEEVTYSDRLHRDVNPFGVRLDREHHLLTVVAPLAPLSAVVDEMVYFMDAFSVLRRHAARLRRVATSDPRAKKKLDSMRSTRQMFCACVLLHAKMENKRRKEGSVEVELPTSGELVALALQVGHEEFAVDMNTSPERTSARLKSWDDTRREVLRRLVPFLEKFLTPSREANPPDTAQGQAQPKSR